MNIRMSIVERKEFIKPKKEYPTLMESKYTKKWVENLKEGQKQKKLGILKRYIKFIGKTPDELILEHNQDMKRDDPIQITHIAKNQLLTYYDYLIGKEVGGKLIKKPVTENSARQYVFSILSSFYAKNNIPIRFDHNEIPKEKKGVRDNVWREKEERIAKDDKKRILKQIRDTLPLLRDKAILHCKISSGMDDVDLFKLKVSDFKRGHFPDYNICYIEGNRVKSDTRYQTFFNGEACNFLKLYLNDREKKREIMNDGSWLFVSNYLTKEGMGKKIKANAFSKNLRETCEKLEIFNITPKSLRKYFNTVCVRSLHDDKEIVERMMGHVGSISAKYQQMFDDVEEFARFYFEHCDVITSLENGGKAVVETKKELTNLRERITQQNEQIQMLLQERVELQKRMDDIDEYNKETEERAKKLEKDMKSIKELLETLRDELD